MSVNYLIILLAALVGLVIGALWFSPILFAPEWKELFGHTRDNTDGHHFSYELVLSAEFLQLLVTAYILLEFSLALHVTTALGALSLAFWLWLGFQATLLFTTVLFENRPLRLFFINALHRLFTLLAMSLIVSLWH